MIRAVVGVVVAGVVVVGAGACTLLLPTDELITPCTVQEDCDKALGAGGFECKDNACLPLDTEGAEGEGEGEGE